MGEGRVPVKCTSEHEVVVYAEFVQAFGEVALVDEAACFVDYDECVDDPVCNQLYPLPSHQYQRGAYMVAACPSEVGRESSWNVKLRDHACKLYVKREGWFVSKGRWCCDWRIELSLCCCEAKFPPDSQAKRISGSDLSFFTRHSTSTPPPTSLSSFNLPRDLLFQLPRIQLRATYNPLPHPPPEGQNGNQPTRSNLPLPRSAPRRRRSQLRAPPRRIPERRRPYTLRGCAGYKRAGCEEED